MAFTQQKETRYVIEKGGAIFAGAIDMDECAGEDEWNDFISGKSRTFSYEDRWKITCCKKSEQ